MEIINDCVEKIIIVDGCDVAVMCFIVSRGIVYGGYYGLVIVTPPPRPRPQTLHRSHDNLKNPYRIASIFYM